MSKKDIQNALRAYQKAARTAEGKRAEARAIYQPDAAEREIGRIDAKLAEERERVLGIIEQNASEERERVKAWAKLDGDQITSDSKLLLAGVVNEEQFDEMIETYRDNYTMLQMLAQYGTRKNAEQMKDGEQIGHYSVSSIPTAEDRYIEVERSAAGYAGIIDMIDNGFMGYGGGPDSPMVSAAIDGIAE